MSIPSLHALAHQDTYTVPFTTEVTETATKLSLPVADGVTSESFASWLHHRYAFVELLSAGSVLICRAKTHNVNHGRYVVTQCHQRCHRSIDRIQATSCSPFTPTLSILLYVFFRDIPTSLSKLANSPTPHVFSALLLRGGGRPRPDWNFIRVFYISEN